jgi:hypothetical protein
MTIEQTIKVPNDHRLAIDLPHEIPTGITARVELKVFPFIKKDEPPLKSLMGVETPIADSLLGVVNNLGDISLDEIRDEKLAKYIV